MNLQVIETYVKQKLEFEPSGHDYLHAKRVYHNTQKLISGNEDQDVIFTCAWIHDLIDHKLDEQYKSSITEIEDLLVRSGLTESQIVHVFDIIQNMSYSSKKIPNTSEGKIVQDADRLDAIGAIGIARAFSYGGKQGRLLYHPDTTDGTDTLSHFYQKLLLLKDKMNTDRAKELATERTLFLQLFLDQLTSEIK